MARKAVREAAVAATEVAPQAHARCHARYVAGLLAAFSLTALPALAGTLPEDRADVMYHLYEGGDLTVDGPSVLVRKSMADKVSVWANYYVDLITSASVDVMATASPYSERRVEWSTGADFVHEDTSMGLSFTKSDESDYNARTVRFGISQTFFGDLTTVGIAANDGALEYTHPLASGWTLEARYRYYTQDAADFYADLFPRANAQNFLARDKELSTFDSHTVGLGVSYDAGEGRLPWVDRGSLTLQVDYMRIGYDDFRDVTKGGTPGQEPLYELDAVVVRAFGSVYF